MDTPFSPARSRPPQPTATEACNQSPSRKTCRRCGQHFQTRNKLMRHLFDSHSPPAASAPKTSRAPVAAEKAAKASRNAAGVSPPSGPRPSDPPTPKPERERPQVHPFSMLSQQQQIAFTFHALCIIFTVGLKQREQEQELQQERPLPPATSPNPESNQILSPQTRSSQEPTSKLCSVGAKPPDQIYQGALEEDSELDDSDDDGGVALSGSMVEDLVVRARGKARDLGGIDEASDLD